MKVIKTILFWFFSFTWGLPMSLFGLIIAIFMLLTGHKPHIFHHSVYFVFRMKGGWGFEAGAFFFLSSDCADNLSMKQHESGHGLQNLVFGWLMPFVVSIPSTVRFWYREWLVKSGRKTYRELPPYDSAWFEGWATELGKKYFA